MVKSRKSHIGLEFTKSNLYNKNYRNFLKEWLTMIMHVSQWKRQQKCTSDKHAPFTDKEQIGALYQIFQKEAKEEGVVFSLLLGVTKCYM